MPLHLTDNRQHMNIAVHIRNVRSAKFVNHLGTVHIIRFITAGALALVGVLRLGRVAGDNFFIIIITAFCVFKHDVLLFIFSFLFLIF